jgi:hypothetical protein
MAKKACSHKWLVEFSLRYDVKKKKNKYGSKFDGMTLERIVCHDCFLHLEEYDEDDEKLIDEILGSIDLSEDEYER